MTEFCKVRGLERKLVCFMLNGREVFETDTPRSIGLKEGDQIDCFYRFSKHYFIFLSRSS